MTRFQNLRRADLTIVIIAYTVFVVLGMPEGVLGVAWPSIRQTFSLSLDTLGILLFAISGAFVLSSFSSGVVASRLGTGKMLIVASVVRALGLAGFVLAPSWSLLVAMGAIYGAGSGLIDAGMNTHFATRYSARLMNWLHASFGLGATIGPLVMTALLAGGASWRWGYAVIGGLQGLMALLILLTLPGWQRSVASGDGSGARQAAGHASPRETLSQPAVWIGIVAFLFYAGVEVTAGQWSYSLFTEARGVSIATAGLWVSIYWGTFTLGRLFFGFIAPHVDSTVAVRASILIAIGASAFIWWNPVDVVSFLGLAAMGFAMAPIFPLLTSATPARVGRRHAANVIGYQVGAASFGIALLPGLAGVLAERFSLEIIGPYLVAASLIMWALFELMMCTRVEERAA